jgi:hypothetical protein
MRYLRTNTAIRLTVGPFLDKTDGITPEVALTATNEHLTLMVDDANVPTLVLDANATASGGNNDMVHVTNDDAGFYDLELTAANLNYLGRAMLSINYVTDHCPVFHEFMILPAVVYDSMVLGTDLFQVDVTQLLGTAWLAPGTAGTPDVNAKLHGGTSQTGRDIGASVLLSAGTGTGQLDFTSGVVKANLAQILGSAITGTAAQLAAAFTKWFNVATPTGTVNSLPDAVAGAAGGVFIAGTNAATTVTTALTTTFTGNLTGSVGSVTGAVGSVTGAVGSVTGNVGGNVTGSVGSVASGGITAASIATDAIDADALAADAVTEIQNGLATSANQTTILSKLLKYVQLLARKDAAIATDNATELTAINADGGSGAGSFDNATDSEQALRDRGDAAWMTATGFSTLDAAGVRSAVGLASANLDTQLAAIDDYLDTEVAAILADTNELQTDWANGGRLDLILDARASQTSVDTIDDYIDTEVAAIKAKTDNLPASPAAVGDIPSAATIADAVWDEAIAGHAGAGSTGAALSAATASTAAAVADAVWDEALSGHLSSGSTGEALNAAGAAGDPWTTSLPGAYGAGSAGYIIGTNIDATVSSRATQTSVDAIDDYVDTEVAAIKAKTDQLTFTTANKIDATIQAAGDFAQAAADKVWSTTSRTLSAFGFSVTVGTNNDKTGYALSGAGVQAIWDALTSALTTAGSVGKLLVDNINAAISSRSSHSAADVWSVTTRLLTAGTNVVLAKGVGVTGFNDLDAAGVRTAVGLASANLDTQLGAIDDYLDTEVAAIKAKTDNLPTDPADQSAVEAAITAAVSGLALQTSVDDLESRLTATRAGYLDNLSGGAAATAASIAALNDLSAAQVNAEVVDALTVDTYAEPTVAPAATSSLKDKVNWLFALARNRLLQTDSAQTLRNDADSADIATATVSDDGTTAVRDKWS